MVPKRYKGFKRVPRGPKWFQGVQMAPKGSKGFQGVTNGSKTSNPWNPFDYLVPLWTHFELLGTLGTIWNPFELFDTV